MTQNSYPQSITLADDTVIIRMAEIGDADLIQAFANRLPKQDLLYLNRDITKRPVIEAWLRMAESGDLTTLVVEKDGVIVATAALMVDRLSWSRHVGEIRVMVDESVRKNGLGRSLIQHSFLLALEKELKKITAQMTIDQKGAIAVFEELGFTGEALIKDHVQDANGEVHDLVILSCDVAAVAATLARSS